MFSSAFLVLALAQPGSASRAPAAALEGTYAEALAHAAELERPLLVEFRADWCGWCQRHERENLVDDDVLAALNGFVVWVADVSVDEQGEFLHAEPAELMQRFRIRRFPTLFVLRPDGVPEDLVSGFLSATALVPELERIRRGDGTLSDLARRMTAAPDELELRYRYAVKLDELGDAEGFEREIAEIRRRDPAGRSLPMRRMALGLLREELWGCMRDPEVEPDVARLETFLAGETDPVLRCDAWLLMGAVRSTLGRHAGALEAYREAWEHVIDENAAVVGNGIAWALWTDREKVDRDGRRFALEVSRRATHAIEEQSGDPILLAQYYDTLACTYYMNGLREEGIDLMRTCVELDPSASGYADRLELMLSGG